MTEDELYNFGLEPKQSVYDYFKSNISQTEFRSICEETKRFRVIGIDIGIKDSAIFKCRINVFDFLPEENRIVKNDSSFTEQIFKKVLLEKKVNFYFINDKDSVASHYDFRLNLNNYCE